MVPPRVAEKMSVVSVESMAFLAPGLKAAERAHRPGSRRPGGVEATGASPGTVPSCWPDLLRRETAQRPFPTAAEDRQRRVGRGSLPYLNYASLSCIAGCGPPVASLRRHFHSKSETKPGNGKRGRKPQWPQCPLSPLARRRPPRAYAQWVAVATLAPPLLQGGLTNT